MCTPTQEPGPMAEWWADHASEGGAPSEEDPSGSPADDIVIDTVAAFWGVLGRPDDAAPSGEGEEEDGTNTPDSFTPALWGALGENEAAGPDEAASGEADGKAPVERPSSLDYFRPAFHQVLGTADAQAREGDTPGKEGGEKGEDAASAPSLNYFAPAFRRALGRKREAPSENPENEGHEDAPQEAARPDPDAAHPPSMGGGRPAVSEGVRALAPAVPKRERGDVESGREETP